MGRRKMLDDVKKREICALATAGMSLTKIARYINCSRRTIQLERQDDPDFDERMRRARMAKDLNPLDAMRRAAATHWRAAAWMLEREERREAERRATAHHVTPEDLAKLANRVKQQLRGVLLDPFDGPAALERIDRLIRHAGAGDDELPEEAPRYEGPPVAETIRQLEQRRNDRPRGPRQFPAHAAPAEDQPRDDAVPAMFAQLASLLESGAPNCAPAHQFSAGVTTGDAKSSTNIEQNERLGDEK